MDKSKNAERQTRGLRRITNFGFYQEDTDRLDKLEKILRINRSKIVRRALIEFANNNGVQ